MTDAEDDPPTRAERAAVGCVLVVGSTVALVVASLVHRHAPWVVAALILAVWIRVNERRIQRAACSKVAPTPLPSPTVLEEGDWVSADGSRVYRKRGSGYAIEWRTTDDDDP